MLTLPILKEEEAFSPPKAWSHTNSYVHFMSKSLLQMTLEVSQPPEAEFHWQMWNFFPS